MSTIGAAAFVTTNDVNKLYFVLPTNKTSKPDYYRVLFDESSQPRIMSMAVEDFLQIKEHNKTFKRCSNEDVVNALESLIFTLKFFKQAHPGIKLLETKGSRM